MTHTPRLYNGRDTILFLSVMARRFLLTAAMAVGFSGVAAQRLKLTNVIAIARENSLDAQIARYSYMGSYWQYRSAKAQLMPSVNVGGKLGGFNHSVVEARDPETGRVNLVNNNTMTNSVTLSVDQQIAATGGMVSLQSYLYRLDQFTYTTRSRCASATPSRCGRSTR